MSDATDLAAEPAVLRPTPLAPAALRRRCDASRLGFATTRDVAPLQDLPGQGRALEALHLGLTLRKEGFNVFALGQTGAGKLELVLKAARAHAREAPVPPAWCYVHNFADPRRPRALRLPAGRARPFARAMQLLLEELRVEIPAAFETDAYRARRKALEAEAKQRGEAAFEALRARAAAREVALLHGESGVIVAPMKGDEVIEHKAFHELPEEEQRALGERMEEVGGWLRELGDELPRLGKQTRDKLRALERDVAAEAVRHLIAEVRASFADLPDVLKHLDAVQEDLVENSGEFLPPAHESQLPPALRTMFLEAPTRRYAVNVFVDPDPAGGAPVITDDSPTHATLFGHIEYRTELGAATTDFTLIEPGALQRANGGTLVLDAREVLVQPLAWEELKRCLRSGRTRIESLAHRLGLTSTITLEPDPIPLDVKVVLCGERLLYYLLAEHDPEFLELFKIAADFEDSVARDEGSEGEYARLIATVATHRGARPLSREAVARLIEHAARAAGDAGRLSLHVQSLSDIIDEADHRAGAAGHELVDAADVDGALDARLRRAARVRDRFLEELARGALLIDTEGSRIGQVNALSVVRIGDLSFGHPSRITARVRVGEGEVIDIQREVELGGPIHSKGVMILSAFLGGRYGVDRPLSLGASLVFEQTYGPVEGDSASAAELVALLSALSGAPVSQALAITGSVNQHGMIQPVGGLAEKIEGFFDACRVRGGPTAGQGVVIPASNVQHLMLRDDVVAAVWEGRFAVYPVATIDELVELVTGVPARGDLASIDARIERRLAGFARKQRSAAHLPGSIAAARVQAPDGRWHSDGGEESP